jgi:hypothetical protein
LIFFLSVNSTDTEITNWNLKTYILAYKIVISIVVDLIMMNYHHHHHLVSRVSLPLPLLLLNQWCTPPLRLQVSDFNTFFIMCNIPSTAVFCRVSIECFPGIVSRNIFSPFVTIPVAPVIYGMMKNFIFHTHQISVFII